MAKRTGVVRVWREGKRTRVCLEFWLEGKRLRIYSDVDRWGRKLELTPETAADLLEDIRSEIRKRRNLREALAPFLGDRMPESEFRSRWAKYVAQKRSEASEGRLSQSYAGDLEGMERRGYLGFLLPRSIYAIDYGVLEDWLTWLQAEKPHLSARTRRHALTCVIGCLRWLRKRGELQELPSEFPVIPVDEHAPQLLSEDSRAAILAAIPEPSRGIFLAMALMGLRVGEARALECSSLQDGFLVIDRGTVSQNASAGAKGTKTRKVRRLPVPDEVAAWIAAHVDPRRRLQAGALFENPNGKTAGKRWGHAALNRVWDAACRAALGHRAASLYEGTRHSFATLALNAGAHLHSVQKFLGHTDPRMTERYAKLGDGALVEVLGARKPSPDRLRPDSGKGK